MNVRKYELSCSVIRFLYCMTFPPLKMGARMNGDYPEH